MSWLQPTERDTDYFAQLQAAEHEQLHRYAQVLAMAARIDPHLLRSLRLRFLPDSSAELELALWFSDLVSSRNATGADMYPGVARLLCDELRVDVKQYEKVKGVVKQLTQHWRAAEQLEQTMRWAVLEDDVDTLQHSYQRILHQLQTTNGAFEKREIARWAKGALATTLDKGQPLQEATWLYQYVAAALGSPGHWLEKRDVVPLPDNLRLALPEGRPQKIGFQVYPGVLKVLKPDEAGLDTIEVTLPIPTSIQFCFDGGEPRWESIWYGKTLRIPPSILHTKLQTLHGFHFGIEIEQPEIIEPDSLNDSNASSSKIILAAMPEDLSTARKLASALAQHNIEVDIVDDRESSGYFDNIRIIRLWSKTAANFWATQQASNSQNGHLLLTDSTAPPENNGKATIFDISGGVEDYINNFTSNPIIPLRKEYNEKNYTLELIDKYKNNLNSIRNEEELLNLTHQAISKKMYTNNFYIALHDKDSNEISFPFILKEGKEWPEMKNSIRKLNKKRHGKTEVIILSGKSLIHYTKEDSLAWYTHTKNSPETLNPLASWLGVPVLNGTEVLAVIASYHATDDHVFSEKDLWFLEKIANIFGENFLKIQTKSRISHSIKYHKIKIIEAVENQLSSGEIISEIETNDPFKEDMDGDLHTVGGEISSYHIVDVYHESNSVIIDLTVDLYLNGEIEYTDLELAQYDKEDGIYYNASWEEKIINSGNLKVMATLHISFKNWDGDNYLDVEVEDIISLDIGEIDLLDISSPS